jgi:hypothetical protein
MMSEAERRYLEDPAFHAAVTMLQRMAEEHGFTPWELKQIAFMAALMVELYARKPFMERG